MGTGELLRLTIAAVRAHTGESQRDLAAGLGLTPGQLSRRLSAAHGVEWTLTDVDRLAAHWGMRPLDVLAGPSHAIAHLGTAATARGVPDPDIPTPRSGPAAPATPADPDPATPPTTPASAAAPPAPATATRPAPPAVTEADRGPDGELVRGEPAPCVLCGQPTPLRAGGHPQHLGGFCTTAPTTAPATDSATTAPPPATPAPPRPAASRERRDTSTPIARAVAQALADNDNDPEAATAVLVRRAIPDGMALLNATRVGSTYDFTHYVDTDEVDILKKPSRDGADQIWEGRPKWINPRIGRDGPRRTVTALDVNGAYLSALKTHLPIGRPRHSATGEYDRKRSGLYLVTPPEWPHDDLPNPLGNREQAGPLWITDPTLRLLLRLSGPRHRLCEPPVIHESWTSGSSEALLERFRRELATARDRAVEEGDTVTFEYVKAMYSKFVSTIGESSANREMRRPDWMHIIRSQAFANLWWKAWKAHDAGLTLVRMMGTDELHVIGDWRRVFPEGRKLTEVKLKTEYAVGGGD